MNAKDLAAVDVDREIHKKFSRIVLILRNEEPGKHYLFVFPNAPAVIVIPAYFCHLSSPFDIIMVGVLVIFI